MSRILTFSGKYIDKRTGKDYDVIRISSTFPVAPEGNFYF